MEGRAFIRCPAAIVKSDRDQPAALDQASCSLIDGAFELQQQPPGLLVLSLYGGGPVSFIDWDFDGPILQLEAVQLVDSGPISEVSPRQFSAQGEIAAAQLDVPEVEIEVVLLALVFVNVMADPESAAIRG